jgi:hypothetical protein
MANSLTRTLLENMLLTNNPSIDVKDPIIKDLAINFGADIIESVETRVKQISDKFSSNYLSNLSSDELDVFALNVKTLIILIYRQILWCLLKTECGSSILPLVYS